MNTSTDDMANLASFIRTSVEGHGLSVVTLPVSLMDLGAYNFSIGKDEITWSIHTDDDFCRMVFMPYQWGAAQHVDYDTEVPAIIVTAAGSQPITIELRAMLQTMMTKFFYQEGPFVNPTIIPTQRRRVDVRNSTRLLATVASVGTEYRAVIWPEENKITTYTAVLGDAYFRHLYRDTEMVDYVFASAEDCVAAKNGIIVGMIELALHDFQTEMS